ncbi:MAG: translation initiation factor IF-2 N-terminal domain-containing protein, partial [Actinomycetota bacterium]|nr:translation initiation factor IF-2 N-terminal domain-containing protein [Actinomycetota bacterium]
MPKKIRVYELARELGLTNKEALDLCLALGIGVKSHSSSIEDAQADRVRRKADAEGLRREVSPPEPTKVAKTAKTTKKASSGDTPVPDLEPTQPDAGPAADPIPAGRGLAAEAPRQEPGDAPGAPPPLPGRDPRLIVSRPSLPPEPTEPRPAPVRPAASTPAPAPAPAPGGPEPARPAAASP